jgi:predicted permease
VGEVFSVIAPVFLCAAAGLLWARSGRPFDRETATALNMEVGAPCLVFSRLATLEVDPATLARMAGGALLSLLAFAALGALVLRAAGLPRHTFLPPLVFANTGNMGLPVCLFAFGEEGLSFGLAYFAVCAAANFTWGPVLWSARFRPGELARTPVVWAVALAVLVTVLDVAVPRWILDTTHLLGDLAIPLMLLTLGVSLVQLQIGNLPRALWLSSLRVGGGFAVGVALAVALGLEGAARGAFVIQCAMPAAVFNQLFAQRYARSPDQVASVVVTSTALAFAGLPLALAWLLRAA